MQWKVDACSNSGINIEMLNSALHRCWGFTDERLQGLIRTTYFNLHNIMTTDGCSSQPELRLVNMLSLYREDRLPESLLGPKQQTSQRSQRSDSSGGVSEPRGPLHQNLQPPLLLSSVVSADRNQAGTFNIIRLYHCRDRDSILRLLNTFFVLFVSVIESCKSYFLK